MSEFSFKTKDIPAKDYLKKHPQPVIMNFQPETFKILEDPEELRIWEQLLIEKVGLRSSVGRNIADEIHANGGTCCESGNSNDCDED